MPNPTSPWGGGGCLLAGPGCLGLPAGQLSWLAHHCVPIALGFLACWSPRGSWGLPCFDFGCAPW